LSSSSTRSTRSSRVRQTREASDSSTIAAMNNPAILTPSGRSITFAPVVYTKTNATRANPYDATRNPSR
jgi:hypothetical protein